MRIADETRQRDTTAAGEPSLMLSLDDVATHLRCSKRTVQRRIDCGHLKGIRDGRRLLIPRWSLEAYLDSLSN